MGSNPTSRAIFMSKVPYLTKEDVKIFCKNPKLGIVATKGNKVFVIRAPKLLESGYRYFIKTNDVFNYVGFDLDKALEIFNE